VSPGEFANVMHAYRRAGTPAMALHALERHADGANVHVALRYNAAELRALDALVSLPGGRGDVTLWLRESDGALVAASVHAEGLPDPWLGCMFAYDIEAPTIEAPKTFLDAGEKMKTIQRSS